jgi:tRNA-splicing ligase RtcB
METVVAALRRHIPVEFTITQEAINCHHNYVERENHFGKNLWVTRKGAIRAREGDLGIIPGSMGQKSYIVRGKGNPQSYCSCSHGAGRKMSRSQARKTFNLADLAAQTEGVECRKDDAVLDEIPGAYKLIDQVMENQKDLVDVVHILKQVLCVKGA